MNLKPIDNRVSQIEFHITMAEMDDFILKAADLIAKGYEFQHMKVDSDVRFSFDGKTDTYIHILFEKKGLK